MQIFQFDPTKPILVVIESDTDPDVRLNLELALPHGSIVTTAKIHYIKEIEKDNTND